MVQIVITVLGLLLMAVAAVMATHYGVESFDSETTTARVSKILTQFNQITVAYQKYSVDHPDPLSGPIDPLVKNGYLITKPIPPAMGNFTPSGDIYLFKTIMGQTFLYVNFGPVTVGTDGRLAVCAEFNKLSKLPHNHNRVPVIANDGGIIQSGCYQNDSNHSLEFYHAVNMPRVATPPFPSYKILK